MTDAQRATIAFIAVVAKKRAFNRSFNIRVYNVDRPSELVYNFREEFTADQINLKIYPSGDAIRKDEIQLMSQGRMKVKVTYENYGVGEVKLQVIVGEGYTFEGSKDNRDFMASFSNSDFTQVRVMDPESQYREFVYQVELW